MTNKRLKPEEIELDSKKRELADLERELVEEELRLETIKDEVYSTVRRFQEVLVPRYWRLEELGLQIFLLVAKKWNAVNLGQTIVETVKQQKNQDVNENDQIKDLLNHNPIRRCEYNQYKDDLKSLYNLAEDLMSPSLAINDDERHVREKYMQKVVLAYRTHNEMMLRTLLYWWESRSELYQGEGLPSELIRTIRDIYHIRSEKEWLIEEERTITSCEEYRLYYKKSNVEAKGENYIHELAEKLDYKIKVLTKVLTCMRRTGRET